MILLEDGQQEADAYLNFSLIFTCQNLNAQQHEHLSDHYLSYCGGNN